MSTAITLIFFLLFFYLSSWYQRRGFEDEIFPGFVSGSSPHVIPGGILCISLVLRCAFLEVYCVPRAK